MAVGVSARPPQIHTMTAMKHGLEQPGKMQSDTKRTRNPDIEIPKENEDSFKC